MEQKYLKKFTRKAFAAWLMKQKDTDTFSYLNNENCLFARFLKSLGYDGATCGSCNTGFGVNGYQSCESWNYTFPKWAQNLENSYRSVEVVLSNRKEAINENGHYYFGWIKKHFAKIP